MQLGLHSAVPMPFRPVRISCMVQMPRLNIAGTGQWLCTAHGTFQYSSGVTDFFATTGVSCRWSCAVAGAASAAPPVGAALGLALA